MNYLKIITMALVIFLANVLCCTEALSYELKDCTLNNTECLFAFVTAYEETAIPKAEKADYRCFFKHKTSQRVLDTMTYIINVWSSKEEHSIWRTIFYTHTIINGLAFTPHDAEEMSIFIPANEMLEGAELGFSIQPSQDNFYLRNKVDPNASQISMRCMKL